MEFVIHVTREDEILGAVPRDVAHRDGLLHRAGCVFLVNASGRVCLAKRASSKSLFGGHIDTACSFHVEDGEAYDEAARRELFEETKVRAELERIGVILVDHPLDRMMVALYIAEWSDGVILDPAEASHPSWHMPKEIEDMLGDGTPVTPWVREAWPLLRARLQMR